MVVEGEGRVLLCVGEEKLGPGEAYAVRGDLAPLLRPHARVLALEHYRRAVRIGKAERDSASSDEAAKLLEVPYQQIAEVRSVRH